MLYGTNFFQFNTIKLEVALSYCVISYLLGVWSIGLLEETRRARSTHTNLFGQVDGNILHFRHHTISIVLLETITRHRYEMRKRGDLDLESADPMTPDQTRADQIRLDYVFVHFLSLLPFSTVSNRQIFSMQLQIVAYCSYYMYNIHVYLYRLPILVDFSIYFLHA